jgi:hypothetical protein
VFFLKSCLSKRQYKNERRARKVAKNAWIKRHIELRPYVCHFCQKWHLTSKVDQPANGVNGRPMDYIHNQDPPKKTNG